MVNDAPLVYEVGDVVSTWISGRHEECEIVHVDPHEFNPWQTRYTLRPLVGYGRQKRRVEVVRRPQNVWDRRSPVYGNVYADWLDEHGYGEAAVALREAFPLADGKGE